MTYVALWLAAGLVYLFVQCWLVGASEQVRAGTSLDDWQFSVVVGAKAICHGPTVRDRFWQITGMILAVPLWPAFLLITIAFAVACWIAES